jgi:putative transposase
MCGERDVSIRRACRVLEVDTSTYHYKSCRHDQAGIEARIKDVCATRVRYGYRRVHVMLRREGWIVNAKKTYRIYNELGLQLRNKTPKRRVKAKLRDDRQTATQPNETWAMDFVHDQLATGRKIVTDASASPGLWLQRSRDLRDLRMGGVGRWIMPLLVPCISTGMMSMSIAGSS